MESMMELAPTSAATVHALLAIRRGTMGPTSEPLDCSSPILDLCIRRRRRSRSPEEESQHSATAKLPAIYHPHPEDATSMIGVSSTSPCSESSETSTSSDPYRDLNTRPVQTSLNLTAKVKVPRPFKAYPKDPLSLSVGVAASECVYNKGSAEAYSEFRKRMLSQVQATHGITNKNMRRTANGNSNGREDPSYWEKRRKNNEAAKRSRDARRAKEDEIAIRAAFLEQENLKLRYEVATLRNEMEKMRSVLYVHGPLV